MNNFEFNPTQIVPQTPLVVEASPNAVRKPKAPTDDWWKTEPPGVQEYAEESRKTISDPRSTLACELGLLEPPFWMAGQWTVEKDAEGHEIGWHNRCTDTTLTFDAARTLIEDRITELGLSAELVHQWPQSRGMSWQEYQAFWAAPLDERIVRFKK